MKTSLRRLSTQALHLRQQRIDIVLDAVAPRECNEPGIFTSKQRAA